MNKPKQPCTKECPDRSSECHSVCEKWLKYEKLRSDFYIERDKAVDLNRVLNDIERDRKKDIATGRMSNRKRRK